MAEAGKIIKLIGDVKAINVNGEKSLNVGDAVSLNDTIRTIGKDTSVDIELSSGKVLHIVGDNVAKIDNSILTSESFENEAAIDDKINNLINNLVNNNGEIELDATAAGEAGAAGATGTLNDVVFDQSGSESTVYADVLSREVDNNVITNFNNNGLGAANLNDLLAQGNQVTPEINGEANNGEIPTIPGNNGANDNVVPENPENNTGNNTQPEVKPEEDKTEDNKQPEVKPEEKPENTEDVVTPEVKPEEDKTEDNKQPEVKPEDKPENTEDVVIPEVKPEEKPENTEDVVTPEVKPEEDKTEDNKQPEVKPEDKPENTEDVVTPEVKPEPTPVVPEDKPVDNVIPSTPLNPATKLFTDILITSINGDNTAVDDRAEVSEGKLVITAKLDDFKGKEGEYTFTVNSNLNNAGLEQKVTAYVNANGEFTFTMDSNVVNNEQGMIKLSIGSVSDTANIFYVPATPDNTDDKPVDVVTPEVKPEDKPENTEDNKQPEVKPEAPLFDKLVITEVNGDESLSDKLAKVDNNELVIKAKLEGFTGNAGDYIFTIGSNIIGATNSVVSKAYVDENGNFTITLDSNIVNQETGLISVSLDDKHDIVRVEYNAPVVEAVDADIKVDIFDNKGTNIEDTLNNNKELTISGSVSPVDANGNKVELNPDNATITINGEKVNATINPDGSFTTTYTPEKDGEVKVEVTYNVNDKIVSDVATTTIDTTAPLLGELTGTPDLNGNYVVEGKTEPNAVVTINGKTEVKADADGNFKATLNDVKDGEKLELVAKDEAGNISNVGTINAKLDTKEGTLEFKVFQGDEDGFFN
ncbi:hypothetical protein AVBRAN12640_05010, partial [Campylobacter sp. RM12640]|uniref:Ig-like domain-containing protein n=1 Tax=unclassified Campylobacter TaxID=2593542 RepID=UPI003014570A|nr:hypothetical protein [Campylobacter sp. RM12640]MBZ7989201.1 hypothetical protein [Campylobacter sp. RM12635]